MKRFVPVVLLGLLLAPSARAGCEEHRVVVESTKERQPQNLVAPGDEASAQERWEAFLRWLLSQIF